MFQSNNKARRSEGWRALLYRGVAIIEEVVHHISLRLALIATIGIVFLAPFASAQPDVTPTPETTPTAIPLEATPTPEATFTPVPTPEATPTPTYDPYAPDLVAPVDPDGTPQPSETPEPTPEVTPAPNAEAASSITVAIGIKGSNTASNLIPINNRKTCLIRLTSRLASGDTDATVWLTSPDDRVRFVGGNTQNQLKLVLPGNLDTVAFDVVGKVGSKAPKDAIVNAHRNYPNTSICGSVELTVWWTSYAQMSILQGENYIVTLPATAATYGPSPTNVAVKMRGQYTLNPAGASFSGFGAGILQNFRSSGSGYSLTVSSPSITYGSSKIGKSGDVYVVETKYQYTTSVPDVANDCLAGAWPLYGQFSAATSGVNTVNQTDGPHIISSRKTVKEFQDETGALLATVTWNVAASINCSCRDWAVIYIKSTGEIYPAAESNWTLNTSTANAGVQKAQNGSSHGVQNSREISSPSTTANQILSNNATEFISGHTGFMRP